MERQWQAEVAKTLSAILEQQREIERNRERRDQTRSRLNNALASGLAGEMNRVFARHIDGSDDRIREGITRTKELEGILRQKQKNLLEAAKKRKAVERLKELQAEAASREERRQETKQLDDFANIRFLRRSAT